MKHIVNKLEFEMECPTEEQAFALRHKLSPAAHDEFAGIIDKVCSKYVSENEWVKIDKIEIELGEFSLVRFEHEFSRVFKQKLESILGEKIAAVPSEKLLSSKVNFELELLEYFLLKGCLPWWADESSVSPEGIISNVFTKRRAETLEFFREHLNNNLLWERASYQLTDDVLETLVQFFEGLQNAQKTLENILIIIRSEIFENKAEDKITVIAGEIFRAEKKLISILISSAPQIFEYKNDEEKIKFILAGRVLKEIPSLNSSQNLKKTLIDKIFKVHENRKISEEEFQSDTDESEAIKSAGANTDDKAVITEPDFKIDILKTDEEKSEKFSVRHAGIILLAPFLKKFFSNLGLLDENIWISRESRIRGLHLLKYLSTGETGAFEFQLILEKIICGIALHEPVPRDIVLSEKELNESGDLLESVIEHWKGLKNTSVNGLRETFLKRDGIITRNESGWLLQIERKTVDVLLESIPWGISTARLPWNEYLIITEW